MDNGQWMSEAHGHVLMHESGDQKGCHHSYAPSPVVAELLHCLWHCGENILGGLPSCGNWWFQWAGRFLKGISIFGEEGLFTGRLLCSQLCGKQRICGCIPMLPSTFAVVVSFWPSRDSLRLPCCCWLTDIAMDVGVIDQVWYQTVITNLLCLWPISNMLVQLIQYLVVPWFGRDNIHMDAACVLGASMGEWLLDLTLQCLV